MRLTIRMRMNLSLALMGSMLLGTGILASRTMENLAAQQVQLVTIDMAALERAQQLGRLLAETRAEIRSFVFAQENGMRSRSKAALDLITGGNPNVIGSNIAMVATEPTPGNTPISVPTNAPSRQ